MGSIDRVRPDAEVPDETPARINRGPEPRIGEDRPTIVERPPIEIIDREFPGLYDRAGCRSPSEVADHRSPSEWVADRNPGYPEVIERRFNCGDCVRACELTWRGIDTQAGELVDTSPGGEPLAAMDAWSPGERVDTDFADIETRLRELGPGSSALVLVYWTAGGAHWFNAFNDGGTVHAVDGQTGRDETWPPSTDGLRFNEEVCSEVEAIFIDADGQHLTRDDGTDSDDH